MSEDEAGKSKGDCFLLGGPTFYGLCLTSCT